MDRVVHVGVVADGDVNAFVAVAVAVNDYDPVHRGGSCVCHDVESVFSMANRSKRASHAVFLA